MIVVYETFLTIGHDNCLGFPHLPYELVIQYGMSGFGLREVGRKVEEGWGGRARERDKKRRGVLKRP